MNEPKIEKGIPIPTHNHSNWSFLSTLEVGDSFVTEARYRSNMGTHAIRAGIRIKTSLGPEGLRVWRVA